MRKNLPSVFNPRQYMLSKDYEIFYYSDYNLSKVDLHSHDYYEFYFFVEGAVSMQIGTETFSIQTGDIMLIPPGVSHRPIIHSQNVPYRRFVFWISADYCNHLLEESPDYVFLMQHVQVSKDYLFHTDQLSFNSVQSKFLRLIEEMKGNRFGKKAQIPLYVNDLILHLNRIFYEQKNPASKKEETALYQAVSLYIEEHLEEDLSLDTLSQKFYVSKYHIAHIFKENLGMSIHQYITKKRLRLCQDAIRGAIPITEAYQTFGFGDYSSFYRAFKKEYGISPKDYRDMQIKPENHLPHDGQCLPESDRNN